MQHGQPIIKTVNTYTASTLPPLPKRRETTRSLKPRYLLLRTHGVTSQNTIVYKSIALGTSTLKPLLIEVLSITMWTDTSLG
jgi:hypothetical protein